jgi:hypothetical protein
MFSTECQVEEHNHATDISVYEYNIKNAPMECIEISKNKNKSIRNQNQNTILICNRTGNPCSWNAKQCTGNIRG